MTISTTRAGVIGFYILNAAFGYFAGTITDPSDQQTYLWGGRGAALFIAVALVLMGVKELSREELREELKGRPGEELWAAINTLLAWGSPVVAVWYFYKGDTWNGLTMLGYPAWLILLHVEALRRANKNRRNTPLRCKLFFYASLFSAGLSFIETVLLNPGPKLPGHGGYTVYPLICIISTIAAIGILAGCYGRLRD